VQLVAYLRGCHKASGENDYWHQLLDEEKYEICREERELCGGSF